MKKKKAVYRLFSADPFDGWLYLPYEPEDGAERFPTVYLLGSDEGELRSIVAQMMKYPGFAARPTAMVALHPHAWAHDYSPLAAPPLREGEPPFTPGAGDHLTALASQLLPTLEKQYPLATAPQARSLAGYSLAGLAALYGAYHVPQFFAGFAAVSPSLWMEGWMAFMQATPLPTMGQKLYLSLGKKEPITKNPRMARVGDCFEQASAMLSAALPTDAFMRVWNDGNHFFEPDRRLARGIAFLLGL